MAKFSVAWKDHNRNISNGLTLLQQNSEFVDMTLAADGHHVKVHQMVISLASPFLKDIINSIQSSHPVIFLTNISYPVLSALLEYIYTGEVLIEQDDLENVMKAARELQIKGLEDVKYTLMEESSAKSAIPKSSDQPQCGLSNQNKPVAAAFLLDKREKEDSIEQDGQYDNFSDMNDEDMHCVDSDVKENSTTINEIEISTTSSTKIDKSTDGKVEKASDLQLQYTISNVGTVQLILNRYMYNVRYTSVKKGPHGHRMWRCVNYTKGKCRAGVITREGVVVKRFSAHNHPFHDKRILKKVRDGLVFSAMQEAETISKNKRMSTPQSESKS